MQTPERRREPRHPVNTSVRLSLESQHTISVARIVDLSAGGMRLDAPGLQIPPDGWLHIRVARRDGAAATAVARLIRSHGAGIAFRFDTVGEVDQRLFGTPGFWSTAEVIDVMAIDAPRC